MLTPEEARHWASIITDNADSLDPISDITILIDLEAETTFNVALMFRASHHHHNILLRYSATLSAISLSYRCGRTNDWSTQ